MEMVGALDIKTVQCDTTAQMCTIDVPAPGFAYSGKGGAGEAGGGTMTFATAERTKNRNTGAFKLIQQPPTPPSSPPPTATACPSTSKPPGGARYECRSGCSDAGRGLGGRAARDIVRFALCFVVGDSVGEIRDGGTGDVGGKGGGYATL
ncbi:hypothetical protein FB451DRAFT_1182899 [Mycena latifolia]|nr:hypothetical protein FB451DRAFT_1182899 [Mycena latifolia]